MPKIKQEAQDNMRPAMPVETGLEEMAALKPATEAQAETPAPAENQPTSETENKPDNFITFAPPRAREARDDVAASNKAILEAILAARNQPPAVPKQQPPIPRVIAQTELEMAEGARMNKHHADQARANPRPAPNTRDVAAAGNTTPVYRPMEHVPGINSKDDNARQHKAL